MFNGILKKFVFQKGDVKRVYSMRECLVGVSLNNKEMELLLQCVTSSVFLRVDEVGDGSLWCYCLKASTKE